MKIHPSWRHLPLVFAVLLGSCTEAAPTNPVHHPKVVHSGWRVAEIGMTRADHDSAGVTEVVVLGPWILARTNKGMLFLGKEGSTWARLTLPDSTPASALLAWKGRFLVGSRNNGKTFSLEPNGQAWKDLHTEAWVSNVSAETMVQVLGVWKSSLLVVLRTAGTSDVMGIWSNADLSNWKSMRSGLPEYDMPIAFLDLDSLLLAATYEKGIYQWRLGDSAWTKAINPQWQPPYSGSNPKPPTEDAPFARAFAKIGSRVWCGLMVDRLFYRDSGEYAWTKFAPDSFVRKIPVDIFAMLTWRGRLFAAGRYHSVPLMHDPATGSWKTTDVNFCYDIFHEESVCDYYTTWSMAATSDTLYAASGGVLLKIGWTDLP